MLLPIHFSLPPGVEEDYQDGDQFNVLWYSRSGEYRLVSWEHITGGTAYRTGSSSNTGQSLWRGRDLVAWSWLKLDIGQPNAQRDAVAQRSADPRMRIDPSIGKHDIAPVIANQLFSLSNRVWFRDHDVTY